MTYRPNRGCSYRAASTSVYFAAGGTPKEDFEREAAGGKAMPSHHSPLFKVSPEPAVKAGVEATVYALLDLMPKE